MKLNYTDQGAGQPVILLHGMFGSLSNLGNLARDLATVYRVISADLRNHGDSPHEQKMDITSMADDVVELLDDLDLSAVNLIGHSLGGKVGMQVALNYPSRVAKLVVADIAPVAYVPRQDAALEALRAISCIEVNSRGQADSVMVAHVLEPETRSFLLKNLKRKADGGYGLKINMSSIAENYGTSLAAAPAGLPYSGPTLFLKGETSAYIQSKHQPRMAELFPNMKLEVINDVGHWLHSENPVEFNRRVTDFLS
jgi:esterase